MTGRFFDTNVLIHLASGDSMKVDRAEAIVAEGGKINVQFLNEFANVARRKMSLSFDDIGEFLSTLRSVVDVEPLTVAVHEAGLALAARYGSSIYDAMIVAAAMPSNCDILWSEDLQNGMQIDGGLRIVNPFVTS